MCVCLVTMAAQPRCRFWCFSTAGCQQPATKLRPDGRASILWAVRVCVKHTGLRWWQVVGFGCIPGRHNSTGCSACIRFWGNQGYWMLTQRCFVVWILQCLDSPGCGWLLPSTGFLCVYDTEAGKAGSCCVQVDKLRHIATPCNAAGIQGLDRMSHGMQELCPFTIHAQCLLR